ncbi:DUF2867 domain-containing protein [Nonomuraea polychroma]|uniref:DUF2867 domain-containing protein n=1 Tax=Nonomuraea polychroma TaxID=46176 RepID=UPI003D8B29EE
MRIPATAHVAQPRRIHEFTRDFRVEDVWVFRTPGAGPDDFPVMLAALRAAYDAGKQPAVVRFLLALRWKVGALFGWDTATAGEMLHARRARPRLWDQPGQVRARR